MDDTEWEVKANQKMKETGLDYEWESHSRHHDGEADWTQNEANALYKPGETDTATRDPKMQTHYSTSVWTHLCCKGVTGSKSHIWGEGRGSTNCWNS